MDAAQGHGARGDTAEGWADRNACAAGTGQQPAGVQYGTCARSGMINARGADPLGLAVAIPQHRSTAPSRGPIRARSIGHALRAVRVHSRVTLPSAAIVSAATRPWPYGCRACDPVGPWRLPPVRLKQSKRAGKLLRGPEARFTLGPCKGVSCLPRLAILISYERHALHARMGGSAPCL